MKPLSQLTMWQWCLLPIVLASAVIAVACEVWEFVCHHEFNDA